MKILKNILKIFIIIFLIVIPIVLIIYNIFIGFMGCYLMINNNNIILETLLKEEEFDYDQAKIVFLDTTAGDDHHITIINKNLLVEDDWVRKEKNDLVEYVKNNGVDVYNFITILNYIYIIAIAIIIFFKKLLENVDMFGKFEESDN